MLPAPKLSYTNNTNPEGGMPKLYIEDGKFSGVCFSYEKLNIVESEDGSASIEFDPIFYIIPAELNRAELESEEFQTISGNILINCLERFIEDESKTNT